MIEAKPKHVFVLIQDLNPQGIQRTFLRLANGLHQAGVKVTVVTCRDEGPLAEMLPPEIPLIVLKNVLAIRKSLWLLTKYIRRDRPDAIMAGDDPSNVIAIVAKFLARAKTRVVIGVHNSMKSRFSQPENPTFNKKGKFLSYIYPLADRIVSVNQGTKKDFSEFTGISPDRVEPIDNPVIGLDLAEKGEQPWLDNPWPGTKDPIILALGRLNREKDYPTLFRAFALLLKVRPAKLLIYGEGEERHKLEALIDEMGLKDHVALPGASPNPYPAMKAANVYVMSSIWEGAPSVLVEALFFGLPIVSTDCTWGPSEILDNGKYGRLVPTSDPQALCDAIITTLDEPKLPQPEESWKRYSIQTAVTHYIDVLFGKRA